MATRPFPTTRSRPLAFGPALALALLLLLTQQWGLIHGLSHSVAGRSGAAQLRQDAVRGPAESAGPWAPEWAPAAVAALDAPAAAFPAPAPRADAPAPATGLDTAADPAADALCSTCLVLATIGALAPPQPPAWAAAQAPAAAPAVAAQPARRSAAAAPFHARAPPAPPVSV